MTIPPDLEAQILRYYHVEKWRVGTIARQLHVHHGTVARVLAQAGLPRIGPPARRSQVEPYLPFIHQTLEKFPTLTASRLYAMVCERGYRGSGDHFRHLIACHRPRPAAEAYLRLRSLPGESLLFQSPCRPAVRARQPPLRAQQHARHHQPAVRRMARGLSKRRLRRLPGRSPGPQRRGPRHRGRILSPQGGPRTSRAARTPTTQSQVMSKVSNALPLTIPLDIPAYWTPEQAFAVVELLDDLRDRIWAHYGVQLLDQYREQYGPADSDHTDETTDNPSL